MTQPPAKLKPVSKLTDRPYTVADAILDVLEAHGVSHIFGYPGGAILPFYDALPYHKNIQHILTRHEQGAAFMAQGWARSTKQIGVCCATSGPGATNLITGIADAMMDSVPILCITGQVPLEMIGKDMFQETDMTGVTLSITKHNYLLADPEETVRVVTEAIKIATSGRPGPVHIDVPKDIMAAPHPRDFQIPDINFYETDPSLQAQNALDMQTIERVIRALNKAERPVLLLGQGIKLADAEAVTKELIEKTNIPAITTILAKGVLPNNMDQNLGMLGMHGYYHCNLAIHEADLILNIGSRFDDRIVGRYDVFGQDALIIHVDIDKAELNKVVTTDMPIHSDAKQFVKQLITHPKLQSLQIPDWWQKIRGWRQEKPYQKRTDIFSMRNVLAELDAIIGQDPDHYIVAVDVGQHQMWTSLSCQVADAKYWLCSGGSGTMGFALPAAIGAAFANPDKTVIAISGDGGFQMNAQELSVIADYGLNVKVLILNNSYLGMVRQWQELFYDNNYSSVAITSPNFVKLADAYRLPGLLVENSESMAAAHQEIFGHNNPYLVEYAVKKEDNVFPMVPGGKHLGETITEAVREHKGLGNQLSPAATKIEGINREVN